MRAFIGLVGAVAAASLAFGQNANKTPVLIELFTSEGCSSCPPADRLLATIDHEQPIAGAQLIVLSEHVDYWNTQGWVDPYSSHELTQRQQRYGSALRVADVYTPQAVIDGRLEVVGSNGPKLGAAIQKAMLEKKVPLHLVASQSDAGIHVVLRAEEAAPRGAVVYFAIAEDSVESKVSAGENSGHMLTHTAVVRSLTNAGKWATAGESGMALDLITSPRWGKHLRVVAFLAERDGGKILGAALAEL